MLVAKAKKIAESLLTQAGVNINGHNPWDIQVKNEEFYARALSQGTLGLGESYMDGWWDCDQLDEFVSRILRVALDRKVQNHASLLTTFVYGKLRSSLYRVYNFQTSKGALEVGKKHYDIGNDLFQIMLDPDLNYTCGYWKDAENLHDAQMAKLALVCGKMQLRPGMKVLDIGCGWGAFARYATEKYGVKVLGVTISQEQYALAKKLCQGLPIEIRLQDYREVNDTFDRIVSLGMFEHVGYKNYRTYMEVVHRCLSDDGLFLLHTIGGNSSTTVADPWITEYIFPRGMIPSMIQIANSTEGLFVMEDWHNFGADYDKTLMAWASNFCRNWDQISDRYDERFYRMWNYYLRACAGAFRSRGLQLWQVVLSKYGVPGGYRSVR